MHATQIIVGTGEYIVNDVCYNAGPVNDIVYTVILTCVCQWIHFYYCVLTCMDFYWYSSSCKP